MVPLLFCKLWQNVSYVKRKVRSLALFLEHYRGKDLRDRDRESIILYCKVCFLYHSQRETYILTSGYLKQLQN